MGRRSAGFGASLVLLVTTIASLFAAQVAPAFALARLSGASLEGPTMSVSREGESVTHRDARTKDVFTVKRAGRVDRFGPEPAPADVVVLPGTSLASVAPLEHDPRGPLSLVTWESPGRHRARLMVFLN